MTQAPSSAASSRAPRRPARAHGEATRTLLLEVAGQLFARQGYEATTSKQVCEAAGVNQASISYHFGSREGLYAAVLVHAHDQFISLETLSSIAADEVDARTKLSRIIDTLVLDHREQNWRMPLLFRAMMQPSVALDPVIEQAILPKKAIVLKVIAEIAQLPEDDPRLPYCLLSVVAPDLLLMLGNRPTISQAIHDFWQNPEALAAHLKAWAFAGLEQVRHWPLPAQAKKP